MYLSIRIKFSRLGPVRYLGHLDMLRYFQKAVLRSGLPVRYSEGFNPHQIMSFAYPLGVSMETLGDYMDLDLVLPEDFLRNDANATHSYEEMVKQSLNSVMHEGIQVERAAILPEGALNAMASVAAADYDVFYEGCEVTQDALREFLQQPEILAVKEGKKGTRTVDIKDGILSLEAKEGAVFMKLRSGSESNIKPQTVMELLKEYNCPDLRLRTIRRLELYRLTGDGLTSLGS